MLSTHFCVGARLGGCIYTKHATRAQNTVELSEIVAEIRKDRGANAPIVFGGDVPVNRFYTLIDRYALIVSDHCPKISDLSY